MKDFFGTEDKIQAQYRLAVLMCINNGIDIDTAYDIIETAEQEVAGVLAGESMYSTPEEVIDDFFSLPADYTWMFT